MEGILGKRKRLSCNNGKWPDVWKDFEFGKKGIQGGDFVSKKKNRQPGTIGEGILSEISTMAAKGEITTSIGTRG